MSKQVFQGSLPGKAPAAKSLDNKKQTTNQTKKRSETIMLSRKFLVTMLIPWFFCISTGCEYGEMDNESLFGDENRNRSRLGVQESGLVGVYYNNRDFTGEVLERVDPTINFNWGTSSPNSNIDADTFSVRWTGFVEARYTETYTFHLVSDDGVKLWVDNKLVIDDWSDHAPRERSGTIALQAGKKYPIRLYYYEHGGGAVAKLLWSSPSQAKQVVPKEQLFTNENASKTNVARGKSTRQSSTDWGGVSSRAVDGNKSGDWAQGSITHTKKTAAPWWIVDLGASYPLSGVTIWNRTDCCGTRLSKFHVDYLDQSGNVIAKKDYPTTVNEMVNIDLEASGVYSVRIQLDGINYLSLAEVEVWESVGSGETSLCAEVEEHQTASLSCESGKTIKSINFASYGRPTGSCDAGFSTGTCHASSSKSIVEESCLDKQSCTVTASNGVFGDPCPGTFKKIAIDYTCGGDIDLCPDDPDKTEPGDCGCGQAEGTCMDLRLTPFDANVSDLHTPQHWSTRYGKTPEIIVASSGLELDVLAQDYDAASSHKAVLIHIAPLGDSYRVTDVDTSFPMLDRVMGLAVDKSGNKYYATAVDEATVVNSQYPPLNTWRPNIVRVVKVDPSGNILFNIDLDVARGNNSAKAEPIINPMVAATARLTVGGNEIGLVHGINTAPDWNIEGRRHQKALSTRLNASTGAVTRVSDVWASHSFDQRLMYDGSGIVELHLGDAYPRQIAMGKEHKRYPLFFIKGPTGANETRTRLGNMALIEDDPTYGYIALFSTENTANTSDVIGGPRNLAIVRVNGTDSSIDPSLPDTLTVNSSGIDRSNKLKWITNYTSASDLHAERPKLIGIGNNKYIVLWEEWTTTGFNDVMAMVIDDQGNALIPKTAITAAAHLHRGDDAFFLNGKAGWMTGTASTKKLHLHLVDKSLNYEVVNF